MRNLLLSALVVFLFSFSANAQIENPVSWNFTAVKKGPKQFEVHMTATIAGNWHIYAQQPGEGPEPTQFSFSKNPLIKLNGKVKEMGKLETMYDPNFKSNLKFYNQKVDFIQNVTLKSAANTVLKGTVTFMVCNERRCLPPKDIPFSIQIDGK
jgi:thiol:disulfide interchange protein DsbD